MSESSNIEWTKATWPIVVGCDEGGPECKNCYAVLEVHRKGFHPNPKIREAFEGLTTRKGSMNALKWNGTVRCLQARLDWPVTRFKKPSYVFVTSMGDLHHDDVPVGFLLEVYKVMASTPQHTYQVLTKRPQNMRRFINEQAPSLHDWQQWPLPNVWLGTSVGVPQSKWRFDELLQTKAAVHFASVEPLLKPLGNLDMYLTTSYGGYSNRLDWVIVGGESGPKARPMHPDWARDIRDQCQSYGVKFFFKQFGEWIPKLMYSGDPNTVKGFGVLNRSGVWFPNATPWNGRQGEPEDDYEYVMVKVGKKAAGRLLDGKLWDEMPVLAA